MAYSAEDIMNRKVVTLHESMTCSEALAILVEYDLSGAPVVNYSGNLVGVISMEEFAMSQDNAQFDSTGMGYVSDYMTKAPITATPSTSVNALSEMMLKNKTHPVVILPHNSTKPIGTVSSIDLVKGLSFWFKKYL